MPISKRDKKISLTKTKKKGKELKQNIIEKVRKNLEEYENLYVFTVENMRNGTLKEVREEWKGSRFFYAKKKIMAIALGQTKESEAEKNLHKLSNHLTGQCGLLFTNKPKDYVVEWFHNYSKMNFAQSGFIATKTVVLPEGPLPDFSHAIEPHLRTLGLPTRLQKGVIMIREEHTVCREGTRLTPEQASILKLLGEQMMEFKLSLVCMWSKDGSFEKFKIKRQIFKMTQSYGEDESNKEKEVSKCTDMDKIDQENTTIQLQPDDDIITSMANLRTKEHETEEPETEEHETEKPETEEHETEEPETEKPETEEPETEKPETEEPETEEPETEEPETEERETEERETEERETEEPETEEPETEEPETKEREQKSNQEVDIPQEKIKTPKMTKTSKKVNPELFSETPMDEDIVDVNDPTSPHYGKSNPRRSMRTPKPIKRTPEQSKHSVKKLTLTASKVHKSTPKGTPKRSKL